jgi:hypothetical protein
MHDACGVIDSACMACGVIDTACKMHAVSLTPHALKKCSNNLKKLKSYAKQRWYANKLEMHAVSLTPHAKYYTACTIGERFERPWQPLKGKSIKNIYVPELSYPTTKKIYKFVHAV